MYFSSPKFSQTQNNSNVSLSNSWSGRKSNRLNFKSGGHLPGFKVKDDGDDDGGAGGVDNDNDYDD